MTEAKNYEYQHGFSDMLVRIRMNQETILYQLKSGGCKAETETTEDAGERESANR